MTSPTKQRMEILFEGMTEEEILKLSPEEIEGLVLNGRPVVFRAGSATVLGEFRRDENRLLVELAHIDGGGEGVLLSIGSLARRYAQQCQIEHIEWIVHAATCAKPNLKLRRVLERRGFEVRNVPGIGEAYYLRDKITRERTTRDGWAEASREIAARGDDALVMPEFANEDDAKLTW
jgi:hypothetical protein